LFLRGREKNFLGKSSSPSPEDLCSNSSPPFLFSKSFGKKDGGFCFVGWMKKSSVDGWSAEDFVGLGWGIGSGI